EAADLAVAVGMLALVGYVVPPLVDGTDPAIVARRAFVLVAITLILAIGTRRTVAALESALQRLRRAMGEQVRKTRQLMALEATGAALAENGWNEHAREQVMDLLVDGFGYTYVSLYLMDGPVLRMVGARGYEHPIETFDGTRGVLGRVGRTRQAELVT